MAKKMALSLDARAFSYLRGKLEGEIYFPTYPKHSFDRNFNNSARIVAV
jgi:hypothetical protein